MKKQILSLIAVCVVVYSYGQQWQTTTGGIYYNGGNVGIGTISPTAPLHLTGNMKIPFNWALTDADFDRPVVRTAWNAQTGDFIAIKHGGNNGESSTVGIRVSDIKGFEFGRDDFAVNLFTVSNLGRVGIGTITPANLLEVKSSSLEPNIRVSNSATLYDINNGAAVEFASNIGLAKIVGIDERVNSGSTYRGGLIFKTRVHTDGADNGFYERMRITSDGNVGIGTSLSSNPNNYTLAVKGKIGAKEVQVENTSTTWPDYVFAEDYDLTPLSEVENYIRENRHLPEIPSAEEVAQKGQNLGEMNTLLLKKIEELTLYVIELERENEALEEKTEKINHLCQRISLLEKALDHSIDED